MIYIEGTNIFIHAKGDHIFCVTRSKPLFHSLVFGDLQQVCPESAMATCAVQFVETSVGDLKKPRMK